MSEEKNDNKSEKDKAGMEHLRKVEAENSTQENKADETPSENLDSKHLADDNLKGYYKLDKNDLAYNGKFYRDDMRILYRGALTAEVRHWSTMDTNNEFDIMEHFNTILKSCVKIVNGSWKDILEVDRFRIVLMIQDVTFVEKPNQVMLEFDCISCDANNKHQLHWEYSKQKDIDEDLVDKYYDEDKNALLIRTKDAGVIFYRPSTLGSADAVFEFLKTQKPAYVKKHNSIIRLLPRLIEDYRTATRKKISSMMEDWYSWSDIKLSIVTQLSEKLDFVTKETTDLKCSKCGTENSAKIHPSGDLKYMFLRRDSGASLKSQLI